MLRKGFKFNSSERRASMAGGKVILNPKSQLGQGLKGHATISRILGSWLDS